MLVFILHLSAAIAISTLFAFENVAFILSMPSSFGNVDGIQINTEVALSTTFNIAIVFSMSAFVFLSCQKRVQNAGGLIDEATHARIFSTIDGIYYLGFTITLIAIIFGLGFGTNSDSGIQRLVQQNAIAISSTAAALIMRTLLCQVFESRLEGMLRDDQINFVDQANRTRSELIQLAASAKSLKENMDQASRSLNETARNSQRLDETIQVISANSAKAYTEQMGEGVKSFIRDTDAFSKKALESYEQALKQWNRLTDLSLDIAKGQYDDVQKEFRSQRATQDNDDKASSSEGKGGAFTQVFTTIRKLWLRFLG